MTAFVHPTAHIEDDVELGEGTHVWHQGHIRTGAVLGAGCNLGKNVFVGPSAVFTNDRYPRAFSSDWEVVETHVRRGASIGANATLICGIEIGEYAVVAAGSVVPKSVRPHQIVMGNPARHYAWACTCGRVVSRETDPPADLRCAHCLGAAEPKELSR